jgi:hypothetical protein
MLAPMSELASGSMSQRMREASPHMREASQRPREVSPHMREASQRPREAFDVSGPAERSETER